MDGIDPANGRAVNAVLRRGGIIALVDLSGEQLHFYSRRGVPPYVLEYLNLDNKLRARALCTFLVNVGRGIIRD